ncbi:site-specific integrase [Planctomycetes bacterium K23_9]|uniref:tyrosine-type recombinase/integrase n=1 Tax=Stieleria marina TaxID=1930275 RepID=UPI0011A3B3F9
MATLSKETGRTGHRLQFRQDGKRRSLYIADRSKRRCETVKRHVEELLRASGSGGKPEPATALWADKLTGKIRDKLQEWGLIEAKRVTNDADRLLDSFCGSYIAKRTDLAQGTIDNYGHARRLLVEHFGEDRLIESITVADAEQWRRWLLTIPVKWDADGNVIKTMAEATVSKHVKRAKTMIDHAVKDRLIDSNPFTDLKTGSEVNRDRDHFIKPSVAKIVLDACPSSQWRLIFALARYGGLRRCEVLVMTWDDVLWDIGRLRIDSPKTGLRECPIFPELLPYLREAFNDRPDGAVRCIHRYRNRSGLGTLMNRVIESAGITPWPKTFQNLRATRRTELQERHPDHVVNAWLGHSSATAAKHYLQVTDDHWEAGCGVASGATPAPTQPFRETGLIENAAFTAVAGFIGAEYAPLATPQGLEP